MITGYIRKLLSKKGIEISRSVKKRAVLPNIYNTSYKKKVLICYITEPFTEINKFSHTNYIECLSAAEIFNELNFQVDVISYLERSPVDYGQYDCVYGMGYALEMAFYYKDTEKIKKIFYSTGCCAFYSNKVTAERVRDFQKKNKLLIPESSRAISEFWTFQYLLSDLVVILGNQFVANTYLDINPEVTYDKLNCFYYDIYDIDLEQKDFKHSKNRFIWFGSAGLLHKGLDIVIDFFMSRPDIELHICGASPKEEKFMEFYRSRIDSSANIFNHGFIEIKSDEFKTLMETCSFGLFLSASEGGSPALLNLMANGGIIPITNDASGLDVDDLGFVCNDLSFPALNKTVNNCLEMSDEDIFNASLFAKNKIRENYTLFLYKENLKRILSKSLCC